MNKVDISLSWVNRYMGRYCGISVFILQYAYMSYIDILSMCIRASRFTRHICRLLG